MRKYLKPALEIEKFDVEDVITASIAITSGHISGGGIHLDSAPIDLIEIN